MTDKPLSEDGFTEFPSVEGSEKEGNVKPVRWSAAPSSSGLGRSEGKVVSRRGVSLAYPACLVAELCFTRHNLSVGVLSADTSGRGKVAAWSRDDLFSCE